MKKILLLFLIVFGLFINVSALTGDVDGDGSVKTNDYILVRKHILKSPELTGDNKRRADVNGDGAINTVDYVEIRKIILGISTNKQSTQTNTTNIKISKSVVNLEAKDKYQISYAVNPSNTAVTWKSDNTNVATVSSTGVVTTNNLFGTAKITATTSSGSKAEVTINVTKQRIHFINLGEAGNAILLDSYYEGKNHYVLIDAGTGKKGFACGAKRIYPYLTEKLQPVKSDGTLETNGGVNKIDALIITHMHYDHAGYASRTIEKFKPDVVIMKKYPSSKSYLTGITTAAEKVGSTIVYPTEGAEYVFGNFKLKIYNTTDLVGTVKYSENINSLVTMASITMGDKTYLTYLPGDLEYGKNRSTGKMILDPADISKKIQKDFGLSKTRPLDIYVAAHHGYYNDDGAKNLLSTKNAVNNHTSVIEPLYIKSAVVTNTFGWLCAKRDIDQYHGIKNIYNNLVKNNGDTNIRFSGAVRVKAIFRANGLELTGGEVLSCTSKTCGSENAIRTALKKDAPACKTSNYVK